MMQQKFSLGRKKGYYNEEMFSNHFEKCSSIIKPNSIIIMDNASYHLMKVKKKFLTKSCAKNSIQEWLSQKKVNWSKYVIKVELLQKVYKVNHFFDKYRVKAIAEKYRDTILRLLPYHCELNKIEMI